MKKISVIVLFIFLPSLLFASGWKFSLGGGYRYINLNDLEAGLDSWNVLMKNVAKNKNIDEGTNIPELEDIEGITSFPGLRLSLEKEIINNLYLFFGVDMYHKSNQPVRDVGNINTDFYAIHNQLKETIDLTSLIMGIRFSPIKSKLFELGTSIDFSANFIKWNYDGIFTWDVIDEASLQQIISVNNTGFIKISKFIFGVTPSIDLSLKSKHFGITAKSGYSFGKSSDIKADFNYKHQMISIFHTPMIDEDSGSLKLWIGEEWIEMGGHQYWIRKYLYSDEKPSETPTLRNIKSAEINLKGLQLVISLNLYF